MSTQTKTYLPGGKTARRFATLDDLRELQEALATVAGADARVAVARGKDKRPVDAGYLENPLTPDEARQWGTEMEADGSKHFILLTRQCHPPLMVLDVDKPDAPHGKKVVECCESAGVWMCPSRSKGMHFYLLRDGGAADVFPHGRHSVQLKTNRADSVVVGEALAYHATAYAPEGHRGMLALSDVPGLYTLLTGRTVSPADKLAGLKSDVTDKVASFPAGARNQEMYGLVLTVARRLREHGLDEKRDEVIALLADVYASANPEDKENYTPARIASIIDESDDGAPTTNLPNDSARGVLALAYHQVLDRHGGSTKNVVVDASEKVNPSVLAWQPYQRQWERCSQTTSDENDSMLHRIGEAVTSAYYDATGDAPSLGQKQAGTTIVWKELSEHCSATTLRKQFDYPEDADVVHYNLGGGKALKVSARRADYDAGKAVEVVDNEPEFRTATRMHAPAAGESDLFHRVLNDVWPEQGVAEWHRMKWAEALCPFPARHADVVSWVGAGGNGKSAVALALCHALGDLATTVDPAVVVKSQKGTPEPRQLEFRTKMIGKRLVFVTEAPRGSLIDEGFIKAAVAGEEVSCGGMHLKSTDARLDGKLFVLSNHRLRLDTADNATARRWSQVQFTQTFDDGKEKHGDLSLKKKLQSEAGGIVRMLMNDIQRYLAHFHATGEPVVVPEAVKRSTADWLDGQNVIQGGLARFLVPVKGGVSVPAVVRGRKLGQKFTGIAALASLLIQEEDSQKNAVREATAFTTLMAHTECREARKCYNLAVTDECLRFLANADVDEWEARRVLGSLFRRKDAGMAVYEDRLETAQTEVDAPPPEPRDEVTDEDVADLYR